MVRVRIEQYYADPGWECEVWYDHAADGEYPAHTENTVVVGEWPKAISIARRKYGDEISSLSVEYRKEGYS